ncbi:MAG: hypothetical protein P8Z67_08060 [Gammaproteobacteria bacterium]
MKNFGAPIEFEPELLGPGPAMHMMCYEPSGCRIELIRAGPDAGAG